MLKPLLARATAPASHLSPHHRSILLLLLLLVHHRLSCLCIHRVSHLRCLSLASYGKFVNLAAQLFVVDGLQQSADVLGTVGGLRQQTKLTLSGDVVKASCSYFRQKSAIC